MTKRAVTYARVSSNDHAKTGGENLKGQQDLCRDYCAQRGYTLIAELAEDDRGASGASFDLPELARALELARAGGFDVLIVRELDRLSRDLAKQLIVEQELTRAGVAIEYVLYDFPDTPEGRLNKNLRAMLAEYEREKIKQRMMRGKRRTIEAGNVMTHGNAPFGYEVVHAGSSRAFAIVEAEAEVIRLIFSWYTEGDGESGPLSVGGIAKELTRLKVLTYTDRRGPGVGAVERTVNGAGHWDPQAVHRILKSETYAGVWHYGKRGNDPIPVEVPAIVSREVWQAAQTRAASNERFSERTTPYPFLLAKRLRCGECGKKLRAMCKKNDPRYLYYRCFSMYSNNSGCTQGTYFRAAIVDAIAWNWIKSLLLNPEALRASLDVYQAEREALLAPIRQRLAIVGDLLQEKRGTLERLLDLYLAGDFERDVLTDRKRRLEVEISALEVERGKLEKTLAAQALDPEARESILEAARLLGRGLEIAEQDFDKRRQLVELLDVQGRIAVEDGKRVLYLEVELLRESMVANITGIQIPKSNHTMPASLASSPRKLTK